MPYSVGVKRAWNAKLLNTSEIKILVGIVLHVQFPPKCAGATVQEKFRDISGFYHFTHCFDTMLLQKNHLNRS